MNPKYEPIAACLKDKQFKEAEGKAKEALRGAPLDGQLWVMLGEALLHQGYGLAAKRVFERAWLLDPQANWVKSMYDRITRTPQGDERVDIEGLLHVPKVTVAAAILTHNEAANIAACIKALQDAVDEIVVIDSSSDETPLIAAGFAGVKVVPIEWRDDFAAARNRGLEHVESDWVIWIDADEVLLEDDAASIREIAGIFHDLDTIPVLHVWHLNQIKGQVHHDFSQTRMFPIRRGLRFWGRIHEQVGTQDGVYEQNTYRRIVRIRLLHHGYDPEVVKSRSKLERNIRLLQMMIKEEPSNPGHFLFLGREWMGSGQPEKALDALLEAERLAIKTPRFGRLLDIYKLLIQLKMDQGDYKEAERYGLNALEYEPNFPDAHYMLAQVRMRQADKLYRLAEEGIKLSVQHLPGYRGNVSPDYEIGLWKAETALGEIAFRSGKLSLARSLLTKHQMRQRPIIAKRLAEIERERTVLNQNHNQMKPK